MSETRYAQNELKAAEAIRAAIAEITDDEDTIRDTLEGEVDLEGMIRRLLVAIEDDQLVADGCDARIADLKSRKDRYAARLEMKRTLIQQAMTIADWQKRELDIATVSRRKPSMHLVINDESKIPSNYWATSDPRLDKKRLKEDLKPQVNDETGEKVIPVIPGAWLEAGPEGLTVRRK